MLECGGPARVWSSSVFHPVAGALCSLWTIGLSPAGCSEWVLRQLVSQVDGSSLCGPCVGLACFRVLSPKFGKGVSLSSMLLCAAPLPWIMHSFLGGCWFRSLIPAAHPSLRWCDPGAGRSGLRGEQPMGQCFKKKCRQGLLPKFAVQLLFSLPKL